MNSPGPRLSLAEIGQITGNWHSGIRHAHAATERSRQLELHSLQIMRDEIGTVPSWAEKISAALPNWGFEICSHRWLEGLDGGLQNACGYATLRRLDIYLRAIGGDDTDLPETR